MHTGHLIFSSEHLLLLAKKKKKQLKKNVPEPWRLLLRLAAACGTERCMASQNTVISRGDVLIAVTQVAATTKKKIVPALLFCVFGAT